MTKANQSTDGYRNFRPFTRTADYLHLPIIAYGEKKLTDYPLWWIKPAGYVIQLFGGENVTFIQTRAQFCVNVRIYFID